MAKTTAIARRMPKGASERRAESAAATLPDLGDIMNHFNEALALLVVCQRSLEQNDGVVLHDPIHEELVIGTAIEKFKAVYEEIDEADFRLYVSREGASGKRKPHRARAVDVDSDQAGG
jgi:hypothetical protein